VRLTGSRHWLRNDRDPFFASRARYPVRIGRRKLPFVADLAWLSDPRGPFRNPLAVERGPEPFPVPGFGLRTMLAPSNFSPGRFTTNSERHVRDGRHRGYCLSGRHRRVRTVNAEKAVVPDSGAYSTCWKISWVAGLPGITSAYKRSHPAVQREMTAVIPTAACIRSNMSVLRVKPVSISLPGPYAASST
jgi:hypothetical protein